MSIETLHERTEILKVKYLDIVKNFENSVRIDTMSLSIPRLVSQFVFHYNDLLTELYKVQDKMDDMYYQDMFKYKTGMSDLSHVSLGTSEVKRMLESSKEYRELKLQKEKLSTDAKIIEEFVSNIKNFSFNVSNALAYKKMIGEA